MRPSRPRVARFLFGTLPVLALGITISSSSGSAVPESLDTMTLTQLEMRRDRILGELRNLASFNFHSGVGAICYRSMPSRDQQSREWIEIEFDEKHLIDTIIIVPTIWHVNGKVYQDDGFPREFRILAGSSDDQDGAVFAEISIDKTVLPRVAPIIISRDAVGASWIRVEATLLSTRAYDGQYIFQLAEVMAFSGDDNVALHQETRASSEQKAGPEGNYRKENVVDGFLPYLMDAAQGYKSNPFFSVPGIGDQPSITFSFDRPQTLTSVQLHTIEQGDTIPHALQPDFALPKHLLLEGAGQANLSDAKVLWNYRPLGLYEVGPIISQGIEPFEGRYFRLKAVEPFVFEGMTSDGTRLNATRIGFAEIELFSGSENIAHGRTPTVSWSRAEAPRPLEALTDGHNIFGEVLAIKEWMTQLAKRHELEYDLPIVNQAISLGYKRQKRMLATLGWVTGVLSVLTVIVFLVDRNLRERAVHRTRVRIAADLHDELGANLHAIALLGDLTEAARGEPQKMADLIDRIRGLSRRTGKALKYCTNILDTPGLYRDLLVEMKQISERLMDDLDHNIEIKGEPLIQKVRPRKRIDLFLFYKECLTNILRHSQATKSESRLVIDESRLMLTVSDNGCGVSLSLKASGPASLRRRARLLGGRFQVSQAKMGGTCITLTMKL